MGTLKIFALDFGQMEKFNIRWCVGDVYNNPSSKEGSFKSH